MYLRVLLTAASLTVASVAAVILECWSTLLESPISDPVGLCSTMVWMGVDYGIGVGAGLALLAVLALIATWVPAARPESMVRDLLPMISLKDNLDRLADVGIKTADPGENTPSHMHLARLIRRLEAVEDALASNPSPARETTREWMRLLHRANDLHNSGGLQTAHFKEINTRLIELFAVPEATEEMTAAAPD